MGLFSLGYILISTLYGSHILTPTVPLGVQVFAENPAFTLFYLKSGKKRK